MDSNTKRSEIEVYDGNDGSRPEYGSLWDTEHQNSLLEHGPEGEFQDLLSDYTASGDVLVLGCGKGRLAHHIADMNQNRSVYGIEISKERLNAASKDRKENTSFLRADAERLPFSPDSFEVVVAHSVLHHLPAWDSDALDEIVRVLTKSGTLVFYEPGRFNPPAVVRRSLIPSRIHTPDEKPFDPANLEEILSGAFSSVEMTGYSIFSNAIPVIDNYSPINIPHSITLRLYNIETTLMSWVCNKPAWILTGVAKNPEAETSNKL